ncbi:atrial natriuretic peptide receptor 1-like [Paramacrobiotus metropolitanus]|uniref:atrial natriuretic peptide receptor 1-like n=1 Tax=Paramacrobiotus metropolitanus TaxID=2943436 RepID=UPI0024459474|nr:atrial natriuretic peptide receptor 1-like [Paramacrobiotus metropolitanus]
MTNGDFIFFTLALQPTPGSPYLLSWKANDADDEKARKAFESVIISSDTLFEWDDLEEFINKTAQTSQSVYNITVPLSYRKNEATALIYDLLSNFAEYLNRSVDQMANMTPAQFAHNLRQQIYSKRSSSTRVARSGMASFLIPLLRLNPRNGKFELAAKYDTEIQKLHIVDPELWKWHNSTAFPTNDPKCGFDRQHCLALGSDLTITLLVLGLCALIIMACGAIYYYRQRIKEQEFRHMFLYKPGITPSTGKYSIKSYESVCALTYHGPLLQLDNQQVLSISLPDRLNVKLLSRNKAFRNISLTVHGLYHANVGRFYGVKVEEKGPCELLMEFSHRGTLHDVLSQKNSFTDVAVRLSFLYDLVKGLMYIHSSALGYHGTLTATTCFIDSRFTLKISHAGFDRISQAVNTEPKMMRVKQSTNHLIVCRADDVHGFGIIAFDALKLKALSSRTEDGTVKKTPLEIDIEDCMRSDYNLRPPIFGIKRSFQKLSNLPQNVVSHMLKLLDQQTQQLEHLVQVKTATLVEETTKTDMLLAEMLPRSIIKQLRNKEPLSAESFDSVSILFSDLPVFAKLVMKCSPLEVIDLLNRTHSAFDEVVPYYDAYKVETINDSYMISSGIPMRNHNHADVLCLLGRAILERCKISADMTHDKMELSIRIGINSGPVVAGVIGTKAPRYCLYVYVGNAFPL